MKREIKFRGQRIKIEDPLQRWIEGTLAAWTDIYDHEHTCIVSQSGFHNDVDPDTVDEYTGQKDKKLTEIYEKDIVRTKKYGIEDRGVNHVGYDVFLVCYQEGGFWIENAKRRFRLVSGHEMEVIGNIHDNPELLKGGE